MAVKKLIRQLLVRQPPLVRNLRKKRNTTGRTYFDDPNDFFALSGVFYDLVLDKDFLRTYFVVDALDACSSDDGPGADELVDLINRSIELSKRVRWIVSSDSSKKLKAVKWNNLNLDLETDFLEPCMAVEKRFRYKLPELAISDAYVKNFKSIIADALSKRPLGDYLLVNVIFTALRAEGVRKVKKFLKETEDIPDLDTFYCRMESKIQGLPNDGKFCMEILQAVAVLH
ncbi:hypothetical protein SLS56_011116 [Neofusicoccum ribis]|uniref:Nephrocystin 3-like N-terminal domain-containing protein n=1 Tax=Neofusicoccum ribis TaxID=45134 RepID=A0ABR3SCF6_9PEZI